MTKTSGMVCVLGVLAIMLCVGLGYGQSGVFDRAGNIPGHGTYSSVPAEKVDLFTGNLMLAYRDIFLPGPEGLGLEIWRVYNSKVLGDGSPGQGSVQAYPKSMLGLGWSMHMGILHQATSNTPIIEFPDGRRETAYPDNYGVGKHITKGFLKLNRGTPPLINPRLYFQNGIVWTFSRSASIPLAGGGNETVYLVTKIEDAKGNSIQVDYDPADDYRSISSITDACGRVVTFHKAYNGGNPARLASITLSNYDGTQNVTYSYSVGAFSNGYYRLDSFTAPCLNPTTFEYNDGTSDHYELNRVTTSFGGVMEFTYANHTFYMGATQINSRVLTQKRVAFNSEEQPAVWNFAYPTYQGVTTGTTTVDGPEFDTSITHNGYNSQNKWNIGLITAKTVSDGSSSAQYTWTYQQISTSEWTVMGINMGTAKGPLLASMTSGSPGDSTVRLDLTYRTTPTQSPKRYGLPTRIASTINGAANPKSYKDLTYYYETHSGYFERYLLTAVQSETDSAYDGTILKRAVTSYFEEAGKWGATSQVQRLKVSPSTYLTWDYSYSQSDASHINISVDPPGTEQETGVQYLHGVPAVVTGPYFTKTIRTVSPESGFVLTEINQSGGITAFTYDNLGRLLEASPESPRNPITYIWQPGGANQVTITQGQNAVTSFWDGMGRDLGHTESGDGTTLYSLRTLDAEGRVERESKGSVRAQPNDPIPEYSYELDATGRPLSITDPLNKTTHITYSGTSTTITDPENHSTILAYADFPGAPTTVTDALNHAAVHTYDAVGRLKTVVFNGARTQSYDYDGLDNVTSESHPETGAISYLYNAENRLSQKTWGGASENYTYNTSGQLTTFSGAEDVTYTYDNKGRIDFVSGNGWSRHRDYNIWGSVTSETQTIPGLGQRTVSYGYDANNILNQVTYPDGKIALTTNNGLGLPETLAFGPAAERITLISAASYGPGKQLTTATIAGNGTALAASYYDNGALNTASLVRGGTSLFNASYSYDGAGNITGISSTAPSPSMSATFGHDALNRLTSASYTSGRVGNFGYSYDAYGNMLTVTENGGTVFNKTYDASNRINGYVYDARGNLTAAGGRNFFWDAQNRLMYLSDISGQIVGDYRYDDRGLRLSALLPVSDIDVTGIPTGGNIDMTSSLNAPVTKTLTIRNFGHASLTLGPATITGQDASQFSIDQQPDSPVAPGGSTTLVVKFLPTSSGNKTARLSIPNNDSDENPYAIALRGYCEPHMDVLEVESGGTSDFGTVIIGESTEAAFTIKNLGTADLVLYGQPVALSGPGSASFTVTQQATLDHIAPNGTSSFTIRFAPNSQGLKAATVSISNNDPDLSPYSFTVTGTGERDLDKIIDEESLSVTSPAGGEEWAAGSIQNITWTGGKNAKAVKIEYSPDNGSTFFTIVEGADNIGVYPWKVPADLSRGGVVRVSDADGPLAAPLIISYEFNFKVSSVDKSSDETSGQEPAHFTFRAAVPDMAAQVSRVANVSFGAGRIEGTENLLFNDAVAEIPAEGSFLGVWHHACVQYDMRSFTGSVWIDERPILSGVSLNTETLGPEPASRVVLDKTRDISVSLWIDDMEVGFLDVSDAPSRIEAGAYGRLFRDHFSKYESPSLLAEGGWKAASVDASSRGLSSALGDGTERTADPRTVPRDGVAGFRVVLDDRQFASKPRAMRLEPEAKEPSRSIGKQVSFPVRVPFAVSADSFSIVGNAVETAEASVAGVKLKDGGNNDAKSPSISRSRRFPTREDGAGAELLPSSGSSAVRSRSTSSGTAKMMSATPAGGSFYVYSFDGRLLAEYNLLGQCVRDYIYMGAQLVAEYQPQGSHYYYYTSDQINSTRVVTGDTGTVVYSAAHDPYGGIQRTWVNTFDPALKFSGKERDGESGLDYFGARYYDKSQYRFLTVDPVASPRIGVCNPQFWNRYAYCGNNPITNMDPDGRTFLIFMGSVHQLLVFDGCGELRGNFMATSNVVAGHTPIPSGAWPYSHFHVRANATVGSPIDELGFYGFCTQGANPPNSKGVHSGYWGNYDAKTEGCIRTDRDAMKLINGLTKGGDKMEFLIVIWGFVDNNGFVDAGGMISTVGSWLTYMGKDDAFIQHVMDQLWAFMDRMFGPLNFTYDYFMNSETPIPPYDY